jgi:membrane protein YdbS with pleckstrin-like domain
MQLRASLKFVKLSYVFSLLMAVALGVYILAVPVPTRPDWAVWGFLLPGIWALFTLVRHIQRRLVKITILGDRLRYEAGLFSKTTRSIELVKVQDVRVDQTLWQRMVGIGDLSLETAGGTSRIELDSIDRPQEAADHLLGLAKAQRALPGDSSQHSGV